MKSKSEQIHEENMKRCEIAVAIGGYQWFPLRFNHDQKAIGRSQEEVDDVNAGGWIWDLAPDYFHDLRACYEAEKALRDIDHERFFDYLWMQVTRGSPTASQLKLARLCVSAPPNMRAEALYQVLCNTERQPEMKPVSAAGISEIGHILFP